MSTTPGDDGTIAKALLDYLAVTHWTPADLRRRAGLTRATTYALLSGRRGLGFAIAEQIERATVEAFTHGETAAPPLRAIDLMRLPREREAA